MEGLSADKRFKDMAETILVTGATGNVGSEVVRLRCVGLIFGATRDVRFI
jgi:NADPH-dependent curcumin reductase CurA